MRAEVQSITATPYGEHRAVNGGEGRTERLEAKGGRARTAEKRAWGKAECGEGL
ncbi:hypothetical protein AB0G15_12470 [Streptosporangium sp. NPDC023825]|uniref:hypothetical protein n=1 Tax=Streptosporangium sp. NPDC023825 TaxID=3154909 RepID=UPI003434011D